jgi:hypothetical protein
VPLASPDRQVLVRATSTRDQQGVERAFSLMGL